MNDHRPRRLLACIVLAAFAPAPRSSPAAGANHLMRYADVHNNKIVFTYEDDLWLVSTDGGDARRITSDPGLEYFAKFSPDGSMIAFTAEYDGDVDVYVMDTAGGVPTRLTYHPASDRVLDWFPDGRGVLFRSNREYPFRGEEIYRVSLDGGMPVKLPVDRAGLTAISPDGGSIAYNRISRESRTWKRHQGGTAQDIWMGSLDKGDFRKITDWQGSDNFPMWRGDFIYFNSDRRHGTLNLYKYNVRNGDVTSLTDYTEYDVKYPSIGPRHVVFQNAESLHLLDLDTGAVRRVTVNVPSDRVPMRPELVEIEPRTGSFGLSPGGERVLLEARGEILTIPVEEGEAVNLTREPGSREKNAAWSPDGRWLAFVSDKTGEEELCLVNQDGDKPWKQLTTGGLGFRMHPVWSPDSRHLLFSDKFMRLNLVEADSGKLTVLDQADYDDAWERWGIQDYVWSPDSKWIAYTKMEISMNDAVFLYSMDDKSIHRVTDELTEDFSPSFDPQGRYLYFLSNRTFEPVMGFVDQNHVFLDMCRPYVVLLSAEEPSPFLPDEGRVEIADGDQAAEPDNDRKDARSDDKKKGEKNKAAKDAKDVAVRVDVQGIAERILAVEAVPAGNYFRLEATEDGFQYLSKTEKEFLKYQVVTDQTADSLDLYHFALDDDEPEEVLSGIANYHTSADGKKLVYRSVKGKKVKYAVADVGKKADLEKGQVDLAGVKVRVDRHLEFLQIYNEAWRVQRDWFYDPGMHGYDWEAVGEKYRVFVPDCGTRGDLNYLIGEMIAELNVGHTYVSGGDLERTEKRVSTGMLGAVFSAEPRAPYYRIAQVIPGTPGDPEARSPLAEPGCPIKVGHYLIAIDGEPVTTRDNVFAFLQDKADKTVTLTYSDRPDPEGASKHRVKTIPNENEIRYREWVGRNRAYVDSATDGQVGYVHLPNMMTDGLIEFAKVFYPLYYKKGFIIDERYNGGGFVGDMIIDRLERRLWALTQPREGGFIRDPERCFHGHMVVLINEDTGSNGEYFAEAIKRKKIAPLIGMRTWGGAVGIEPHQNLMDGGVTTPPQFAPYDLNRQWMIEGHGVDPDFEVQNMPGDVLKGIDSQLDAAIKYVSDKLRDEPMELPPRPDFPDKSKRNLAGSPGSGGQSH